MITNKHPFQFQVRNSSYPPGLFKRWKAFHVPKRTVLLSDRSSFRRTVPGFPPKAITLLWDHIFQTSSFALIFSSFSHQAGGYFHPAWTAKCAGAEIDGWSHSKGTCDVWCYSEGRYDGSSEIRCLSAFQLCFVLSILGNSPILLLDEPSTGMDPGGQQQMWWALS